jgi:hypothetical protein
MKLTGIVAFLALSACACAIEPDQSEYLPLHVGDEWIMDVTLTHPNGEITKPTGRRKIERTVQRDGKTYLRLRLSLDDSTPMTKLLRKDGKGLHSLVEGVPDAKEQLEIPMPLKSGHPWNLHAGDIVVNETIVGLETVTIGKQSYEKCYHIRIQSTDGKYREDSWEAPKVGLVKSVILYPNHLKLTQTLRRFKPGK